MPKISLSLPDKLRQMASPSQFQSVRQLFTFVKVATYGALSQKALLRLVIIPKSTVLRIYTKLSGLMVSIRSDFLCAMHALIL